MENGNSTPMYMPVAPAYNNGGFFGGDMGGGWWLILLVLLMGGGLWGGFGGMNGFGGGFGADGLYPWLNNSQHISDGFRDQNLQTSISGLQNSVTSGFGDVQLGLAGIGRQICETGNGISGAVRDGFYGAEIAANSRQMANTQQLFGIQSALQNCCCENRAGIADLKYTVASEECATRTNSTQNTQGILSAINGGIQSIKDQLCQDKIDTKNETIAQLRQELAMKDLAASQTAQNAFIQQGFSNEVDALYNRLSSCPVPSTPVYGRTPIFTCNNNPGCGCGAF